MLKIVVPATPDIELFDEEKNEFLTLKGIDKDTTITLEHSLYSISKWEQIYKKPYINRSIMKGEEDDKTSEEIMGYIRCMTLEENVDPNLYNCLTPDNFMTIQKYINDPMTATTINRQGSKSDFRPLTNEVIYYMMISNGIPTEFEHWHLNRLITLLEVFAAYNEGPKKMSMNEILRQNAALNAARRKKFK